MGHMPHGLPRAVEYPLQGNDLTWLTRQHVQVLSRLSHTQQEPSYV